MLYLKVVLVIIAFGCQTGFSHPNHKSPRALNTVEVVQLITNSSENALIIDVRTFNEVKQSGFISSPHAPTIHIPVSFIGYYISFENERFKRFFRMNKPSKDRKIITYCRSGSRAESAANSLLLGGYDSVYFYDGSFIDDFKARFPSLTKTLQR